MRCTEILCIGSYVYHSDVIVVVMPFNANKYKVNSTYYYQVYYIKPIIMYACDPQSPTVVVIYVDAMEFKTRKLIHGIELLYIIKG